MIKRLSKYPKVSKSQWSEIMELIATSDDTYQECVGYYTYGHWDSQTFAIAVNQEYDLTVNDGKPIWVEDVKQSYIKTAASGSDLPDEFVFSQLPRIGYRAATYVEI